MARAVFISKPATVTPFTKASGSNWSSGSSTRKLMTILPMPDGGAEHRARNQELQSHRMDTLLVERGAGEIAPMGIVRAAKAHADLLTSQRAAAPARHH